MSIQALFFIYTSNLIKSVQPDKINWNNEPWYHSKRYDITIHLQKITEIAPCVTLRLPTNIHLMLIQVTTTGLWPSPGLFN